MKAPLPLQAATWTHVAVTAAAVASSLTITLYVGGRVVATLPGVVPYPADEAPAPFLCIGASDIQNVSMFGALAEVRFWTFAATPAQLRRTMLASLKGSEPGLAGYWTLAEDSRTGRFANRASTGKPLDGILVARPVQPVISSSDGAFLSMVAGVGGATALAARAFLPAHHWNHLAVVYEAAGALLLNRPGADSAAADYGVCQSQTGLVFGTQASVEAWVQTAASDNLPKTILSQWGVDPADQAFLFGIRADGTPYLDVTIVEPASGKPAVVKGTSAVNVLDGKAHHVAATYSLEVETINPEDPHLESVCTVTVYVDGKAQTPAIARLPGGPAEVNRSSAPVTVGISALSTSATGPVAYSAQAPFVGLLTGIRFWSVTLTLTPAQVQAAMAGRRASDDASGVVSAWWFDEHGGLVAADRRSGNDLTLTDTDVWGSFAAISTLDFYGNGVPVGVVEPAPSDTTGGYQGDPQFTVGAYMDKGAVKDGLSGQLAELRLWRAARSRGQILEARNRGLNGDEDGLTAYWTFNGTTRDETGRGADGNLIGQPPPGYVPSLAPVANEGPQVRNAYRGPATDFQERLDGRPAVIEYPETQTRPDGSPLAIMRRAYLFVNPALAMATGYGLGEMDMVYVGQVQTNPTLIGYIEGAPPCPSENLSRPLYLSSRAYNAYLDATAITVQQDETTSLTFTSSDYRTSSSWSVDVSGGFQAESKSDLFLGFVIQGGYKVKDAHGGRYKHAIETATQDDEKVSSSWTSTVADRLGLRGTWEPEGQRVLNPMVGRRYEPLNLGYALVESLTADLYALRLRSTHAMLGRAVVPDLAIPPDRNVLMFRIDPGYVKNGTLDGKVGLVNDPRYDDADVQRGSYFKPTEAYALAAVIAREEAHLQAYFEQFRPEQLAREDGPGLEGLDEMQFFDFAAGRPRRGIVNRYVWTATGGLHQETEQFSAAHERTFAGIYQSSWSAGFGSKSSVGGLIGVYGALDMLWGGQIKVQVGRAQSTTKGLSLQVVVTCDPTLQAYDAASGTFTTALCPGKVDAYRFMTFYLPPSAQNADDFQRRVVDQQWLQFSSDPAAMALRQARVHDNGVWRVLHRVTYVSRIPPSLDTNPNQTVAPQPPHAIDVEGNAFLLFLVQGALGQRPPTPANIGAAVATVLAPRDGTSPSRLGDLVPWWATFLQSTRGSKPDPRAVALMDRLLVDTVSYVQAGYAAGVLPLLLPISPSTRPRPPRLARRTA